MRFFNREGSQYTEEFRPITDSQPFTFGYPSQILLKANIGLDRVEDPTTLV